MPGRIELMIHRIGKSDDDLGANTPMRELDQNNNSEDVEVRANFWLLFTSDRGHALKKISERHTLNKKTPLYFVADSPA